MNKFFKSFLYMIACVVVFLVLIKVFGGYSTSPNPASAFEWEKPVTIYLGNKNMGSDGDCSKVFPVTRIVPNSESLGLGALMALLDGVSESEKEAGYFTSINNGVLLQNFEILDGVVYIDFDSRFNEGVAGSCRIAGIKSQIETTLNTLPDIDSVVISVNRQTKGILEP